MSLFQLLHQTKHHCSHQYSSRKSRKDSLVATCKPYNPRVVPCAFVLCSSSNLISDSFYKPPFWPPIFELLPIRLAQCLSRHQDLVCYSYMGPASPMSRQTPIPNCVSPCLGGQDVKKEYNKRNKEINANSSNMLLKRNDSCMPC